MKIWTVIGLMIAILGTAGCTAAVVGGAAGAAGGYIAGQEAAENEDD